MANCDYYKYRQSATIQDDTDITCNIKQNNIFTLANSPFPDTDFTIKDSVDRRPSSVTCNLALNMPQA